jgi:hypothetical protein
MSASLVSRRRVRLHVELLETRTVPTLLGQQLFPGDNPWNQRIADAPVAANSAAIIDNIVDIYGNGQLHPDFGEQYGEHIDLYGIPFNIVHGNTAPKVNFVIDAYDDESDVAPVPMPASVVIEGDWQDGPRVGLNNRGDSHLIIWDVDNNVAYEFYRASRPGENADEMWHADQQSVWDMDTSDFRTLGWTSADAAGLAILPGLVRPDEALPVDQGGQGVINHAIRMTLQNAIILNQFLYPASHTANPNNDDAAIQPPMGARFRLKASVDISQFNPQARIVAQAMKDYGLIVADNGSNFYFQGASFSVGASNQQTLTFDDEDVQSSTSGLKALRFSDFEVVDLRPRVVGIDLGAGPAGTEVVIVGQNFAGAGGQLHVWFGDNQATGVAYIDDAHVRAVVPAGTGTVDVRVQIGVSTAHPRNHTGTIFGYGISDVNPDARFTYSTTSGNTAPTVAQPASATPVAGGMTTNLSVLGSDNGGKANLIYEWSVLTKPFGAADPTFSVNNNNAAQNAVATFSQRGSYTFRVTIRDAQGLVTTSDVNVVVNAVRSALAIAPAVSRVRVGSRTKFNGLVYDQFGDLMSDPSAVKWKLVGAGTLNLNGRYTAPKTPGGPYRIVVALGSLRTVKLVKVVRRAVG